MRLEVNLALAEKKPVLRHLLADYLSELSRYGEVEFAYRYFDTYWDKGESRWPYLFRENHQLVGFAFVNNWSPSGRGTDFSMAEFYIVSDARRRGVGRDAAKTVLLAYSGVWELSVMSLNASARRFWPNAIEAAQARQLQHVEHNGEAIYRFRIG